jgi:hypothetical protein
MNLRFNLPQPGVSIIRAAPHRMNCPVSFRWNQSVPVPNSRSGSVCLIVGPFRLPHLHVKVAQTNLSICQSLNLSISQSLNLSISQWSLLAALLTAYSITSTLVSKKGRVESQCCPGSNTSCL